MPLLHVQITIPKPTPTSNHGVLYLNVPDALDAGGVDVGVVGGGDAARGLPPQDAAATVHHPLKSAEKTWESIVCVKLKSNKP